MRKTAIPILLLTLNLWGVDAIELAKRVDEVSIGYGDSISTMHMLLINANGEESSRQMLSKRLEGPKDSKEIGDKTLIKFISPEDIKDTALLTYEKYIKNDDQWIYLPALKRTKRITSRSRSGSFMGSEFSYEDLSSQKRHKYEYDNVVTESTQNGIEVYINERYPKDKNSGYTKQIIVVDKARFLVLKIEYYDRKKELLKSATFDKYRKIKGFWRVGYIHIVNHQTNKETKLTWENETLQNGLSQQEFSRRKLK